MSERDPSDRVRFLDAGTGGTGLSVQDDVHVRFLDAGTGGTGLSVQDDVHARRRGSRWGRTT